MYFYIIAKVYPGIFLLLWFC